MVETTTLQFQIDSKIWIPIADALSRCPTIYKYPDLVDDLRGCQVCATDLPNLSAFTEEKQREFRIATNEDLEVCVLPEQITTGWSETRAEVPPEAWPYWDYREELTVHDGLLFWSGMRSHVLSLIHSSYQGVVKSKMLAIDVLFLGWHE